MKKLISKLLLFTAVLAMAFSLAACGKEEGDRRAERREEARRQESTDKKNDDKNSLDKDDEDKSSLDKDDADDGNSDKSSSEKSSSEKSSSDKGSSSSTGSLYGSMAEYVNSDEVQSILDALKSQMTGSGMNIAITADGDKMIYTYTYDSIEKQDGMAEQLESAMKTQESTFQSSANEIAKIVKADKPSVVISYVDCKGQIIYSREFTAE